MLRCRSPKPNDMSEVKYTPGPWFTYFDPFTFASPKGGWQIKADDSIKTPVCVVAEPIGGIKGDDGFSPRQKANARLIAAAPEMLEALESLLFMMGETQHPSHGAQNIEVAITVARETIKKAKGE